MDDVGYYQCFVAGKYGTAMSHVTQLVMGVLDEFTGGETSTQYEATEYSKFFLPCNAPRSVPDAEYFWSYQTSSSDTDFVPVQLDSRLQVDQQGHVLYLCNPHLMNSTATFVYSRLMLWLQMIYAVYAAV